MLTQTDRQTDRRPAGGPAAASRARPAATPRVPPASGAAPLPRLGPPAGRRAWAAMADPRCAAAASGFHSRSAGADIPGGLDGFGFASVGIALAAGVRRCAGSAGPAAPSARRARRLSRVRGCVHPTPVRSAARASACLPASVRPSLPRRKQHPAFRRLRLGFNALSTSPPPGLAAESSRIRAVSRECHRADETECRAW